jgi:hypothetical protein
MLNNQPLCLSSDKNLLFDSNGKLVRTSSSIIELKTGLISVWDFEETSGTSVADTHSNNDLTNVGATINQTGKLSQCYSYDGYDDRVYFDAASDNLTPISNHSISAWVKRLGNSTGGAASTGVIMSKYWSTFNFRIYWIDITNSNWPTDPNRLRWEYWDSTSTKGTCNYVPISDIWTNEWMHIVVTRNTTTMKIYVNGNNVATETDQGNGSMIQTTSTVRDTIGCVSRSSFTPDLFFNGLIDQVAVWNITLSQEQVKQLYNGNNGFPYSNWI